MNLLYTFTPLVTLILVIAFFTLIFVRLITKTKPKIKDYILIVLIFAGIYPIIPYFYTNFGILSKDTECLKKALKLSIYPTEKEIIYYNMGLIYENTESLFYITPDINLAIEYYEKYLNGNYKKNTTVSEKLQRLYLLKGNYDKVKEIENSISSPYKMYLTYSYIMQDKYKEALDVCQTNYTQGKFLKADLYEILGEKEPAKILKNEAEADYNERLKTKNTEEYKINIKTFSSVESVKAWVEQSRKYYKI